MGIVIRQATFTTLFAYIGVVVGYINVLWLFPYVFTPKQIGLFRVIHDVAILSLPFAQFSLNESIVKFSPSCKGNQKQQSAFMGLVVLLVCLIYLVFTWLFFVFKDALAAAFIEKSPLFIEYFLTVWLLIFVLVLSSLLEAWCHVLLKITLPSFFRYVAVRVLMSCSTALYFFKIIDFDQWIMGIIIVYGIEVSVLVFYLTYLKAFKIFFQLHYFNKAFVKKLLLYSLYTLAGGSGFMIVTKIDNIMLSAMVGLQASGIYTTMAFIGVVIEMPKRAIRKIASPMVAGMFARKDWQGIQQFYQKVSTHEFLIGLLLFMGIYVNLDNVFYFIPHRSLYEIGKPVVLFIGLSKLIDMAFSISGIIISMSTYFRFNMVTMLVLAVATVVTNYWMIPIFGMNGAAAATVVSLFIYNLLASFFVFVKFKMQPFSCKTLHILAIGCITFGVASLLKPMASPVWDILVRSLLMASVYGGLAIAFKVSPEVNGMVIKMLQRLWHV